MPLLLLQNGPDASASVDRSSNPTSARVAHTPPAHHAVLRDSQHASRRTGPGPGPVTIEAAPVRNVVPTTTTTTVPPTTTTTTTTTVPPTTTTTTATTLPVPLTGETVDTTGIVTYYGHPAGRCASPWLPFGTVVRITNPANGRTVTCLVDDREADRARSIDLSTATFAELAPLSQGVIHADLSW